MGRRAEPRHEASTTAATGAAQQRQQRRPQHDAPVRRGTPIDPLYLMMQLPGVSTEQEFVLQRPFVPRSKANQLSAFMVARNDGDELREARRCTRCPDDSVAPSPSRAATLIEADPVISQTVLAARPARLAGDAGRDAADPDRQRDLLRPADLRGGAGRRHRSRAANYVAVTYGENAVLDQTSVVRARSGDLLGGHDTARRASPATSREPRRRRRPPRRPTTPEHRSREQRDRRRSSIARVVERGRDEDALARPGLRGLRQGRAARRQQVIDRGRAASGPASTHDHAPRRASHDLDRPGPGRPPPRPPGLSPSPAPARDCRGGRGLLLSR